MPSPLTEIKDGAGAYTPQANGKDVTPGNVVIVRLVSQAGVDSWLFQCVSTDETSDKNAVNAALAIDPLAKTATFTAPVSGKAYRFLSVINQGRGPDGTIVPTYSTTLIIHTLTAGGARVIAADETTEANILFGYITKLNPFIRNPSPGSGEVNTSSNQGTGGAAAIAEAKSGADLPFRGILGVKSTTATVVGHNIEIDADGVDTLIVATTGNIDDQPTTIGGRPVSRIIFTGAAPIVRSFAGGSDKRRPVLCVANGGPVVIVNEYGSATAANRSTTGTGANVTITQGADGIIDYDATGSRWRLASGAAGTPPPAADDFCESVADHGASGNGVTDDAPAFRAAIAAAAATDRKVCVPPLDPGLSYRFASTVLVNEPVTIFGAAGARWGKGRSVIKPDAGVQAAFTIVDGTAKAGGSGGTGANIEGIEIECTPSVSVLAYAPSTAYTLGQIIKRSTKNDYLYEVIKAGTTSAADEATAFILDPHVPDRATSWSTNKPIVAGQMVRGTDNTHWDVVFIASGSGTTHSTTEPTWNYVHNSTTNDNGITWTAKTDEGTTVTLGTVVCKNRIASGLFICCPCNVRDVAIKNAQTAGVTLIGNVNNNTIGDDARHVLLEDMRITLPGGVKGTGVYTRGGQNRFVVGINIQILGSHTTGQGATSLPVDGTQLEHGIKDESFAGANMWLGCNVKYCRGYDYWAAGASTSTQFISCTSDAGRVRLDAAAIWLGAETGTFWSSGGSGYASAATSVTGTGLKNGYETIGLITAALNKGSVLLSWQNSFDTGTNGWRPNGGGWNELSWASSTYSSIAMSDRQVPTSANIPAGEEAGVARIARGLARGDYSDYLFEFVSLNDYRSTLRGGYRRVGDVVRRPDVVASAAYASQIVTTSGYTGATWVAGRAYEAFVAAPSSSAHVASIVIPASGSGNAFKCTTAGTGGGSEPNWATAPSPGNTINDGSAILTNVGSQPTLLNFGYIGTLPGGGGGEANTSSNVGSGAQLAKTKSGVDLPFRSIVASSPLVATQNTNDVTLSVTWPGSDSYVFYRSGGTINADSGFSYASGVATLSTAIVVGTSTHTTAKIRLPNSSSDVVMGAKDGSAVDRPILSRVSTDYWQIGTVSAFTWDFQVGAAFTLYARTNFTLKSGGADANSITANGTRIGIGLPRHGDSTPYASEGYKPLVSVGTHSLTSSEYSRKFLSFDGGSSGTQTFPNPASDDASYDMWILVAPWTGGAGGTISFTAGSFNTGTLTRDGVFKHYIFSPNLITET